jgi:hypothetical protein
MYLLDDPRTGPILPSLLAFTIANGGHRNKLQLTNIESIDYVRGKSLGSLKIFFIYKYSTFIVGILGYKVYEV